MAGGAEDALAKLNRTLESVPQIKAISQRLGIRPALVVVVVIAFLAPFLLFGIGGQALSLLFGGLIPAFQSFKVIELLIQNESAILKDENLRKETTFLLKYWVIFGVSQVLEIFCDFLFFWVPMYYLLKIGFIGWLLHGKSRGAEVVYDKVLRGWLLAVAPRVDQVLAVSGDKIGEVVGGLAPGLVGAGGPRKEE